MAGIGGHRRAIPGAFLRCPGEKAENRRLSYEVVPGGLQHPGGMRSRGQGTRKRGRLSTPVAAERECCPGRFAYGAAEWPVRGRQAFSESVPADKRRPVRRRWIHEKAPGISLRIFLRGKGGRNRLPPENPGLILPFLILMEWSCVALQDLFSLKRIAFQTIRPVVLRKKTQFSRSLWAGRRCTAASIAFFKGKRSNASSRSGDAAQRGYP